jgi:hypothetical protein
MDDGGHGEVARRVRTQVDGQRRWRRQCTGASGGDDKRLGFGNESAANGYDRRDPRFRVASDELTVEN